METTNPAFQILNEIRQLGCTDEALCAATYRTYLHLSEERAMWNVQYYFSNQLDTLYLKARKQRDSLEDVYIPVPSNHQQYSIIFNYYPNFKPPRLQFRAEVIKLVQPEVRSQKLESDIHSITYLNSIPLEKIERLQAELAPPSSGQEQDQGSKCLVLAVCDPSSTVLLYRMSGAIKPVFGKPLSRNKMLKQRAQQQQQQQRSGEDAIEVL